MKKIYSTKYVASKEICDQSFSVGSSLGYLISINCERNTLFVFNSLTDKRTELPAKDTFLGRIRDDMDNGGEFVDEERRVLHEGGLLTDKAAEPLVCPYRTLLFGLFRMDFEKETWVSMKSLYDQAIFVGGNHSPWRRSVL
uniref:KIB1-4 beta-propeller domain-containing protein n=1 Tax=Populus trichocarpa TaxID=3694 RepID=A0A2K2AUE0_POPTR